MRLLVVQRLCLLADPGVEDVSSCLRSHIEKVRCLVERYGALRAWGGVVFALCLVWLLNASVWRCWPAWMWRRFDRRLLALIWTCRVFVVARALLCRVLLLVTGAIAGIWCLFAVGSVAVWLSVCGWFVLIVLVVERARSFL